MRDKLRYEAATGKFFWLPRPVECFASERSWRTWNSRFAHKEAGCRDESVGGYVRIRIGEKLILAHRLAFFYMTRRWPENEIDHINCDRSDNRWANLRQATRAQNCQNRQHSKASLSPLKGVSFHKLTGKWLAGIKINRRRKHLGLFDTAEAAHAAYKEAAQELFKDFARSK